MNVNSFILIYRYLLFHNHIKILRLLQNLKKESVLSYPNKRFKGTFTTIYDPCIYLFKILFTICLTSIFSILTANNMKVATKTILARKLTPYGSRFFSNKPRA